MPRSALIVNVPEADPVVGEWRERYDNARLGIPAHITLLFPFVPSEELDGTLFADLHDLFATQPPIMFDADPADGIPGPDAVARPRALQGVPRDDGAHRPPVPRLPAV